MGGESVGFQIVSDQGECLRSVVTGRANYEDEYYSVSIECVYIDERSVCSLDAFDCVLCFHYLYTMNTKPMSNTTFHLHCFIQHNILYFSR